MKNILALLTALLLACFYTITFSQIPPSYEYDNLNRLIQVTHADGTITSYQYDAGGNRTRKITLTELALPLVETFVISGISATGATVGGNVINSGGATVNERGVYWGASPNPENTGTKLQIGSGIGSFSTLLSGLAPETPYYVKAYATNSEGTAYGVELSFTTLTDAMLPFVNTQPVIEITSTTAISGGIVTNDGGEMIISRGVVWNTFQEPTLENNDGYTSDGNEIGEFISEVSGLTPATTYYLRAYAKNIVGTHYGDELSFTTESSPTINATEIAIFEVNTGISYVLDGLQSLEVLARYGGGIRMDEQGNVHLAYGNYNTIRHVICMMDNSIISTVVDTVEKKVIRPGLARNDNGYYIVSEEWDRQQTYNSYTDNRLYFMPFNGSWQKLMDIQLNVYHEQGGAKDLAYSVKESPNGNLHILYERTGWWSYGFAQKVRVLDKNTHSLGDLITISSRASNHPDVARNFALNGNYFLSPNNSLIAPLRDHQSNFIFLNEAQPEDFSGWTDIGNTLQFNSGVNQWTNYGMWQDNDGNVHSTIIQGGNRKVCYSLNWSPFVEISDIPAYSSDIAVHNGWIYVLFSHSDPEKSNEQGNLYLVSKPVNGSEWSLPQQITFESTYYNNSLIRNFYFARPFGYIQPLERLCFAYTVFDGYWVGNDYLNAHLKLIEINRENSFTIPTVYTTPASNITYTTAISGGGVINNGGADILTRGVVWNTSGNPTLIFNEGITFDGIGLGEFESNMTNLLPETTYFVRAYATNSIGTAYGEQVEFTTTFPSELLLTNITINPLTDTCFNASQTITITNFSLLNGGSAIFIAGEKIIFQPTSLVEGGGYLHAYITLDQNYCMLKSSMLAVYDEGISLEIKRNNINDAQSFFKLYPNPTTSNFTLELLNIETDAPVLVEIYTIMGEKLIHAELKGHQQYQFDLLNHPRGVYLVRVIKGDEMGVEKLIKR